MKPTIIVQSSVTQVTMAGHLVEIRTDGGRHVVTTGRYGRKPAYWKTYHDARRDAVERIARMVSESARISDTSCDGTLFQI